MSPPAPVRPRADWSGFLILAVIFIIAATLSWRKWTDPLIDFGVQLYLPERLAAGDVLYRDVAYLTGGPLSQYYHALLYKIFGASFQSLIFSNLAIAAGMLALIYHWFRAASDNFTALTIGVAVILIFTFGQLIDMGNYSYAAPYSHEALHGLALSVLTVSLLAGWLKNRRIGSLTGAGFCFGLVFMTKPEIFSALAICGAATFILDHFRPGKTLKSGAVFLTVSLVPLLVGFLLFLRVENWQSSLRSVAGAWQPLVATSVTGSPFYQWCLGLDSPWLNLAKIAGHFLIIGGTAALFAFLFRRISFSRPRLVFLIGLVALLLAAASAFDWTDCGRALPLLNLVLLGFLFRDFKNGSDVTILFPLLWSIFSLALMGKLGLFPRIWHYGFVLAMPAFAGAIYLLLWRLPRSLESHGVPFRPLRITAGLVLFVGILQLFVQSQLRYEKKTQVLGAGADRMYAFSTATSAAQQQLAETVAWLETNTAPSATLAVLPEGAVVNFLSHRTNPTPFLVWTPFESAIFGEDKLVGAFAVHSPDYILLTHRNMDEFQTGYFGDDPNYGAAFRRWLESHYQRVFTVDGDGQLRNFGVMIFKRLPSPVFKEPVFHQKQN